MRALVLTLDQPRHRYFARAIAGQFVVPAVLVEEKRNYYNAQRATSPAVRRHFECIAACERQWFAEPAGSVGLPIRRAPDINAPECVDWARSSEPDVVCLFGTAILREGWLNAFPGRIVNLHLGLSPFYRGSATLFWPFVNRELHYLGTTIHVATAKVDAGDMLARIEPDLRPGEDYYTITTRLIRDSVDRFPQVVRAYLEGRIEPQPQEPIGGRLYRKVDFDDEALARALAYAGAGVSADEVAAIRAARPCLSFS